MSAKKNKTTNKKTKKPLAKSKKTVTARSRKTKMTATKSTKARGVKGGNPAFMKPMMPSTLLATVVGNRALPRTEVTKRLWGYIKKNNLQDEKERRYINAD